MTPTTYPPRKIGLAPFYNSVFKERGLALAPHHYPIVKGLEDRRINSLLILGPPGIGKSTLLSEIYPMWELGHDPTLTILSVSAGEKLPQGFMAAVMQIIQHSKVWAELFPDVRPDQQVGWSMQRGLFVTGHHPSDPDASYVACGLSSKALTGMHARLHVYDDIHDRENSQTPEGRAHVRNAYYDTLMGRADPQGTRKVAVGRWWAEDDLYQELIANGDWVVLQLPAARPGNTLLWYDVSVPKDEDGKVLSCIYSEELEPEPDQDNSAYVRYRAYYSAVDETKRGFYWPASPSKRAEYDTVRRRQPRTAAINYNGDISGGGEDILSEQDFRPFIPPGDLSFGISQPEVHAWARASKGDIEQAWDTALGQPQSESLTVALTALLVPCTQWHRGEDPAFHGKCDFHFDVLLLDAMVKDIDFRELVLAFRNQYSKWHPRMVTVEEKQSGIGLLQTFKGSHIPLRGQKVQQGKMERAINPVISNGLPIGGGAASVQGWLKMGRVMYPTGARWIEKGPDGRPESGFLRKVTAFKGGTRASDEFDALVHIVTRAISRSHRNGKIGMSDEHRTEAEDEAALAAREDPRRHKLDHFGMLSQQDQINPFDGMCGAPCSHYGIVGNKEWCAFHGRATSAISGCGAWTNQKTTTITEGPGTWVP